jgi:Acetyltransferase (GNAT) domain
MLASPEITTEQMANAYSIVRLSLENISDLAALHADVYDSAPAGEALVTHYVNKYNTEYTGVSFAGFIAYNHQLQPVAYYGVVPCFIQQGEKKILAAQSADTMTHPKHRFKGMFVELSLMTFNLCRQLGIQLLFGFPNENSYHGAVNKLGWQPVTGMSCFTIPVKTIPLTSIVRRLPFLSKWYHRYRSMVLRGVPATADSLSNTVVTEGFAGTCRDADYNAYKNGFGKSRVVMLAGANIRISLREALLIGDMNGVTDQNAEEVIARLKRLARRLGLRQIQFHCSEGISLHRLFRNKIAPISSYHVLIQDFGATISPSALRFVFADLDIF